MRNPYECHREFLPLPCFEDRDLKAAQKEHKLSYRDFIDQTSDSVSTGSNLIIPFGSGKRGQPLKVIVRHADPKADMILDVLVRIQSWAVGIWADDDRKMAYSTPCARMCLRLSN